MERVENGDFAKWVSWCSGCARTKLLKAVHILKEYSVQGPFSWKSAFSLPPSHFHMPNSIPGAAPLFAAGIAVTNFCPFCWTLSLPIKCDFSRLPLFSEPPPFLLFGVLALPWRCRRPVWSQQQQSRALLPGPAKEMKKLRHFLGFGVIYPQGEVINIFTSIFFLLLKSWWWLSASPPTPEGLASHLA